MQRDTLLLSGGSGLTLVIAVVQMKYPDMAPLLLQIGFFVGALLIGIAIGGLQASRRKHGREFGNLMTAIERLCADEHELGLRGRFVFSPDNVQNRVTPLSREDRARFQASLRALDGPCVTLELPISAEHIRRGIEALSPDLANVDVSQAYGTLNVLSQTLKSELADKYRLSPST